MYRYYITERPPMVGTIPNGAVNVTAFEDRQLVTEIGREAYGYAEYTHRLHPQIVKEFELVPVITIKDWNIESVTGYKPLTTFYRDFSIADAFGIDAIEDTFFRAFSEWQSDYKYLTELVLVLNWKSFEHDDSGKSDYVEKYCELHENSSPSGAKATFPMMSLLTTTKRLIEEDMSMCYGEKPFDLVWQEFDRRGEIITKRKSFRDKNSRDKFVLRLYDKDNFWQVLAYSEEGSAENYDD